MTEMAPEDSVLRRHYEAMRAHNPTSVPTDRDNKEACCNEQVSSCGFMGWLKRLFTN